MSNPSSQPEDKLLHAVLVLNAKMLGLTMGIMFGLAIFIATNWLVIKGGPVVGPHLELLNQFFLGYRVSFLGSIIGFFYGFAIGTFSGTLIAWIYNKIVALRN